MLSEKEKVIALTEIIIDKYNYVLNELFLVAYETTPQAFRLADKNNIKIVHAKFNETVFRKDSDQLYLIYFKNGNLEYGFVDFRDPINNKNYSDFSNDIIFMTDKIAKELDLSESDILYSHISTYAYLEGSYLDISSYKKDILETYESILYRLAKDLVREHGSQFQKHSNLTSGYYAKNAARYSYSLLDLDPIIKKVNDEDFEYQLDQAIAAYDNSLYMASCATLGVCLETVCKLILTNNGKKIKDSDPTMLDKLSDRLKSEGLIKYKDKSRIDVCYKVRNLSSHTSPGKVTQNDCHFLINTIQSLVEEYF